MVYQFRRFWTIRLSNSAVGAEYTIMEKVNGRDLGDIWYEFLEKARTEVVVQVARLESVLFSISLPRCGGVYFKRDLENGTEVVNITAGDGVEEGAGENAGQLYIGPDVAQIWWCDKRDSCQSPMDLVSINPKRTLLQSRIARTPHRFTDGEETGPDWDQYRWLDLD